MIHNSQQLRHARSHAFEGLLEFKAHRPLYHSTLGSKVMKKTKELPVELERGRRVHARGRRALHPTPPHPEPCALYPAPCTLHPAPCTLHPAPCTPHPAPCTLNPEPDTQVYDVGTGKLKWSVHLDLMAFLVASIRSKDGTTLPHPPLRQPRGKRMISLVNSHSNATSRKLHLREIDLKFANELSPG